MTPETISFEAKKSKKGRWWLQLKVGRIINPSRLKKTKQSHPMLNTPLQILV
jgi:uncharacterized protein YegP (UPF0339 family)